MSNKGLKTLRTRGSEEREHRRRLKPKVRGWNRSRPESYMVTSQCLFNSGQSKIGQEAVKKKSPISFNPMPCSSVDITLDLPDTSKGCQYTYTRQPLLDVPERLSRILRTLSPNVICLMHALPKIRFLHIILTWIPPSHCTSRPKFPDVCLVERSVLDCGASHYSPAAANDCARSSLLRLFRHFRAARYYLVGQLDI